MTYENREKDMLHLAVHKMPLFILGVASASIRAARGFALVCMIGNIAEHTDMGYLFDNWRYPMCCGCRGNGNCFERT